MVSYRKKVNHKLLVAICVLIVTIIYFINNSQSNTTRIQIFDLNIAISEIEKHNKIPCRRSIDIYKISTTLCYHSLDKDAYLSNFIAKYGIWEPEIVEIYLKYALEHDDWLIFDVGSNVGTYTLFGAKAGRHVVAVEAFKNILLVLTKAAHLENTKSRITLINNAISNESNKIELLNVNKANVGAQGIIKNKGKQISEQDITNKTLQGYFVRTILFDELLDYLPVRNDGTKYTKEIMKIDIEGAEPLAFQHAEKLFKEINFQVIIMEWQFSVLNKNKHYKQILEMLEFIYSREFNAYSLPDFVALERDKWQSWPIDIIWQK